MLMNKRLSWSVLLSPGPGTSGPMSLRDRLSVASTSVALSRDGAALTRPRSAQSESERNTSRSRLTRTGTPDHWGGPAKQRVASPDFVGKEEGPDDADMTDGPDGADMTEGPGNADMDGPDDADMTNGPDDADMMDGPNDADMMDGLDDADMTDGPEDADVTDGPVKNDKSGDDAQASEATKGSGSRTNTGGGASTTKGIRDST